MLIQLVTTINYSAMALLLLHDVITGADGIETVQTAQKTPLHCCCLRAAA
jgi:hypothetical protein